MPADSLHRRIEVSLQQRKQNGNLRSLDPLPYDPGQLVDFSSNDYLSLSKSRLLQEQFQQAIALQPLPSSSDGFTPYGPASSRLLDGNTSQHIALEQRASKFFRGESALLFNSGYDANSGVFGCLSANGDAVLYDELIHASAHDGMRNSRSKIKRPFRHNSSEDLERIIIDLLGSSPDFRNGRRQIFVAVEALYSMDGDLAPLPELLTVIERTLPKGNGHLIVDEAHSTGLYGPAGRGLTCAYGVESRVLIRLHTFGKAMSCSGGEAIWTLHSRHAKMATFVRCHTMQSNTADVSHKLCPSSDILQCHAISDGGRNILLFGLSGEWFRE